MIVIGCMIIALAAGIGFAVARRAKTADIEEIEPERISAGEIRETKEVDMPQTVRVENPSWDYYIDIPEEAETEPLELVVLEQTKNEITDEEKWFAENGLELPDLNDEGYDCLVHENRMMIDIIKNGKTEVTLDFSDYQYADDFLQEEKTLIGQVPLASKADYIIDKDGRLFVRTYHTDYVFQIGRE